MKDETFKHELAREIAALARVIRARDKCSDQAAVDRAMAEYHKIARRVVRGAPTLEELRARKVAEDTARAEGRPTLKVSLGDHPAFAALRAKLAGGES